MLHLAIKGEIHNLLTALRLNQRWGCNGRFTDEFIASIEQPLTKKLKSLQSNVANKNPSNIDVIQIVSPFVAVLCSSQTSGQITGKALTSLYKLLLYGLLRVAPIRAKGCIALVAKGITNCRFEDTHKERDESVIVQLLELIVLAHKHDSGLHLSEKDSHKMFLICYRVSSRDHASELLRSSADNALARLILSFFSGSQRLIRSGAPNCARRADTLSCHTLPLSGLIMDFLCDLIYMHCEAKSSCILAFSLINMLLEATAGTLASCPVLLSVVQGKLSKSLLEVPEADDLKILSLRLRVVFNLFNIKDLVKLHLERILVSTHLHILTGPSYSPDQRELALESLLEFCCDPAILLHLYVNYDCNEHCGNLFGNLCHSLASAAMPLSHQPMNLLNFLAVNCLLQVVEFISSLCLSSSEALCCISHQRRLPCNMNFGTEWLRTTARDRIGEEPQQHKCFKKSHALAAEYFNEDDKWISKIQSCAIFPEKINAVVVAEFLHETQGLDKRRVGEMLSKGPEEEHPFHAAVRHEYASRIDVHSQPFDVALRNFLSGFRLPGEAQCIDRIMEAFAGELYDQWQDDAEELVACPFSSADSAFVLAFSTIMLQTDLHNPAIGASKRMSPDDFIRNNRGINDGGDLPAEFLRSLYHAIKDAPIRSSYRPTRSTAQLNSNYVIKESPSACKNFEYCNLPQTCNLHNTSQFSARIFDPANESGRDMFQTISETTLLALLDTFHRSYDTVLIMKLCEGFRAYARLCDFFRLPQLLDHLLAKLLLTGGQFVQNAFESSKQNTNRLASPSTFSIADIREMTVFSEWRGAVPNRHFLAFKEAFAIISKHGYMLRDAWAAVIDIFLDLADRRGLPRCLIDIDDVLTEDGISLAASPFALRCKAHWTCFHNYPSNKIYAATNPSRPYSNGIWSSIMLLWQSTGHEIPAVGQKSTDECGSNLTINSLPDCGMAPVKLIDTVLLATGMCSIHAHSARYPLATVSSLLAALLDRVDPTVFKEVTDFREVKALDSRAALALEYSWRVIINNRHRVTLLWPQMHAQLSHFLSCGLISGFPYLAERSMVIILRAANLLIQKNTEIMLLRSLRLIHQISHDVMIHIADRLALGLLGLLRMQQLKVEVLIPLLAEADEHRRGQPLVTAASLTIVDSAPKGHHFNKMWTACRQLVLTNIERQLKVEFLLNINDAVKIASLCNVQQILVALVNRHKACCANDKALCYDIRHVWTLFSRAAKSRCHESLNKMAHDTELLLEASGVIDTSNEPKERTYIV